MFAAVMDEGHEAAKGLFAVVERRALAPEGVEQSRPRRFAFGSANSKRAQSGARGRPLDSLGLGSSVGRAED